MSLELRNTVPSIDKCTHCGNECIHPIKSKNNDHSFCCLGCQSVYDFLAQSGIAADYYQIKSTGPNFGAAEPIGQSSLEFSYIDQSDFKSQYVRVISPEREHMTFYIEGIHCLACLWLLEKIPQLQAGIESAKLDLSNHQLDVMINPLQTSFGAVATLIDQLGHRPHPIKSGHDTHQLQQQAERRMIVRIGLAAFCAGNIMVYNAGLYTGASGTYAQNFAYTTMLLAAPALTYSAWPFYRQAFTALKHREPSLDIPIALGLIVGAIASSIMIFWGQSDNYFDTLSTLVFLVLLSRFTLSKLGQKGLDASEASAFIHSQSYSVKRASDTEFSSRHSNTLKAGDLIKVNAGDVIPVDGVVRSGKSCVHYALLSGEATPLEVHAGTSVSHGGVNIDDKIEIEALKVGKETNLGQMIEELRKSPLRAPRLSKLSKRASKTLIIVVPLLALATITFGALTGELANALARALALLVITCPCALGLSIPLTFSLGLRRAERLGLLIKDEKTLEDITHIKHVAFDKTGTLTEGQLKLTHFTQHAPTLIAVADIIFALERESRHPIGKSLCEALLPQVQRFDLLVEKRQERSGSGVSGVIDGVNYELRPLSLSTPAPQKMLGLYEEELLLASLTLSDRLRPDTQSALESLKAIGLNLHLLSGDQAPIVHAQTKQLPLETKHIHSELLPQDKVKILESLGEVMMVGDGVNDASALQAAQIGVAVKGSSDASIRSADVYCSRQGLTPIVDLLQVSKQTERTLKAIIAFSLFYNAIAITCALAGYITPLWAAVFMPVSSLSSFLLSTSMMRTKKHSQHQELPL